MKYLRTNKLLWLIEILFVICISLKAIQAKKISSLVAKKVECASNPKLVSYHKCTLKAISREKKIINLWANFTKPLENLFSTFKLYRRYSGWRPYLFNFKINFCDFIKSGSQSNPLMKIFLRVIKKYSNLDHPCPYNHPVYIRDLDPGLPGLLDFGTSLFPNAAYKLEVYVHEAKNEFIGHFFFQGDVVDIDV